MKILLKSIPYLVLISLLIIGTIEGIKLVSQSNDIAILGGALLILATNLLIVSLIARYTQWLRKPKTTK